MFVLHGPQSIEQALPLGHLGRDVRDVHILQDVLDLGSGQPTACIGKNPAGGFEMLRIKGCNSVHVTSLRSSLSCACFAMSFRVPLPVDPNHGGRMTL